MGYRRPPWRCRHPPQEPKTVKGWKRLFGACRGNERDLAIVAVRRKTLTRDELRIKKDAARNDEYLGEVEDACLCWRYDGQWHRVTDLAGHFVNVWFRDGRLHYAQNVEVRANKRMRLSLPPGLVPCTSRTHS